MGWFSELLSNKSPPTCVSVDGKTIEVFCTRSADRMLAKRNAPLLVEIELAFACILRKQIRFHDAVKNTNAINVNDHLALLFTTHIPDTCETNGRDEASAKSAIRSFTPKWVRIDHIKGEWAGDCGL